MWTTEKRSAYAIWAGPFVLATVLVLAASSTITAQQGQSVQPHSVSSDSDLPTLRREVEEIRREQLDYRVEKDLLKETYSSNYQMINMVLTIVLAAFTVLSVAGFRSISTIKGDFNRELSTLKNLKARVEAEVHAIEQKQKSDAGAVEELTVRYDQQEKRLRILEIRDKAEELFDNDQIARAMEYVTVGLELDPRDVSLLKVRGRCLGRTGRITEALASYESALELEPGDVDIIENVAEILAISAQQERLTQLRKEHRVVLERRPNLVWYLEFMVLVQDPDPELAKDHVRKFIENAQDPSKLTIADWDFSEATLALPSLFSKRNSLASRVVGLLSGQQHQLKRLKELLAPAQQQKSDAG